MKLYSTAEAAKHYHVTRQRISAIAATRGIKGRLVGNVKLWTADDVWLMKPGKDYKDPSAPRARKAKHSTGAKKKRSTTRQRPI